MDSWTLEAVKRTVVVLFQLLPAPLVLQFLSLFALRNAGMVRYSALKLVMTVPIILRDAMELVQG